MPDFPFEAVIFDLDGTVYLGDSLIPGADRTISRLRDAGVAVIFLTNKAIDRRETYSRKLTNLGVPTETADIINSGWVTAQYIKEQYPESRVFVIGEDPLVDELEAADIEVTTEEPGELVVVSMDRKFTYEKLDLALQSVNRGAPFVATNPDRTCPVSDGEIPDAAGMIGAVEEVTGETVDAVLGKPSRTMVETLMEVLGAAPEECLMVGDRPETDIAMGDRAGMQTALVLSGVTDQSGLEETTYDPDYIFESVADLGIVTEAPRVVSDE